MSSTCRMMMAPAASSPATTGWTAPVASRITMPMSTAIARLAPAPSGTPCWRTSAGESTTSTSGSDSRLPSSAPHVPRSSSASPIARRVSSSMSSPRRWTASTTKSPLSVTMPGYTFAPMRSERGETTTSAMPASRVTSDFGSASRRYSRASVRAWRLRSGGIASPLRCGSSRSPKRATIATVPATSGMPTSANRAVAHARSGGDAIRCGRTKARPERDPDQVPDDEEQRPRERDHDHVRQHHRDDGADPGVPAVALREDHDQREVRHQRRDRVRGRVAGAIGREDGLRRDVEPEEERDEDRREDRPLGDGRRHDEVHQRSDEYEPDQQPDGADVGSFEPVAELDG